MLLSLLVIGRNPADDSSLVSGNFESEAKNDDAPETINWHEVFKDPYDDLGHIEEFLTTEALHSLFLSLEGICSSTAYSYLGGDVTIPEHSL